MAEQKLDCRGLACPNPVLRTKEIIDRGGVERLSVLVDNPAAKENVCRFLSQMGFEVSLSEQGGVFEVNGARKESAEAFGAREEHESGERRKIAVLIGTDRLGTGDDTLGKKLVFNFIDTLKEMGPELWQVILLNGGVKLAVEDSDNLPALQRLEKEGVLILVCGTCLNYFGLFEKKRVGETTNMLDIVTAMQVADKVISLT
ncbi:MAG: sulfurtransferase-like selenium metabolism protein YedF [Syntrophobacteraceae bacterium]|jgi:selenium metabolism protein YedF